MGHASLLEFHSGDTMADKKLISLSCFPPLFLLHLFKESL